MTPPLHPLHSSLIIPLQIIFIFFAAKTCSVYEPIFLGCSNDNYTSPSSYETSLHRLFTDLIVKVGSSPVLYLYNSAPTSNQSSIVYVLVHCRPDLTTSFCFDCLNETATLVTSSPTSGGCGHSISAALLFDQCLLLYSDHPNFDFPELRRTNMYSTFDVPSDPVVFMRRVKALMLQVVWDASAAYSRFAVGAGFSVVQEEKDIYGMAWCRLDPMSGNCTQCLQSAIGDLQMNMTGGRVVRINCLLRFEVYPFFKKSLLPSATSPEAISEGGDNFTRTSTEGEGNKTDRTLIISISGAAAFILVCVIFILVRLRGMKLTNVPINGAKEQLGIDQFLYHELGNIRAATSDFSEENKLGEGGFGAVYRGILRDGQEIAVKRLSKTSMQGLEELKNEVAFVAKLQHRNLVRLLGCSLEKEEKLLVYEFLLNKSLDKFLFDPARRSRLEWDTRYKIIEGVAQGLLYLHVDSRFRVVHCDLKASNILLDCSMNPKISDFGFAKHFGINEAQRKTNRIAGTQGYMAPEYAMRGLFSTKSDVYSYGVLVLETITGRRSVCLDESVDSVDLLSNVGENWKQGQPLQAVDPSLGNHYVPEQVLRCIQIGLLCIQEDPAQRPSMASLVVMLSTSNVALPNPLLPTFIR